MTSERLSLVAIGETVLTEAESGVDIEVFAARGADSDVVVHAGQVESVIVSDSAGVGIRVVDRAGRAGFSWTSSLQADDVRKCVESARHNCQFSRPSEFAGLPHPDGVGPSQVEIDLAREPVDLRSKIESAVELDQLLAGLDPRVRTVKSVRRGDAWSESFVMSSTGIRASSSRSSCFLSTYVIVEHNGQSAHGRGASMARAPEDVDLEAAAQQALTAALAQLGSVPGRSGRYVALFEPAATATLLGLVATAFTGAPSAATSLGLSLEMGAKVSSAGLGLVDDPTDAAAFGAARYDGEGLATRATTLIRDGAVAGRLLDTRSAQAMMTRSTGAAVRGGYQSLPRAGARALRLTSAPGATGAPPDQDLVITDLTGLDGGVDARSGRLSLKATGIAHHGVAGWRPVRDLFLSGTLSELLASIVWVGPIVPVWPGVAMGNQLVADAVPFRGR